MIELDNLSAVIDKEINRIKQELKLELQTKYQQVNETKQKIAVLIPGYITQKDVIEKLTDGRRQCQIEFIAAGRQYEGRHGINSILDVNQANVRLDVAESIEAYEEIVVINPTVAFLKRVAEMEESCFLANMVFESLLRGKPVEAKLGFSYANNIDKRAFLKANDILKELESMGMVFKSPETKTEQYDLTLLTEADVLNVYQRGEKQIELAKDCIVTPLAQDIAKEKQIALSFRRYG